MCGERAIARQQSREERQRQSGSSQNASNVDEEAERGDVEAVERQRCSLCVFAVCCVCCRSYDVGDKRHTQIRSDVKSFERERNSYIPLKAERYDERQPALSPLSSTHRTPD